MLFPTSSCPLALSGTVPEILLDTDVFIDHLRGARPLVVDTNEAAYAVVTRCELFAGSHTDEAIVAALLAPFRELLIDRAIAERAGRIRRSIGTPVADALIAGTALEHRLVLVTRNRRHFENIPGLQLAPPRA